MTQTGFSAWRILKWVLLGFVVVVALFVVAGVCLFNRISARMYTAENYQGKLINLQLEKKLACKLSLFLNENETYSAPITDGAVTLPEGEFPFFIAFENQQGLSYTIVNEKPLKFTAGTISLLVEPLKSGVVCRRDGQDLKFSAKITDRNLHEIRYYASQPLVVRVLQVDTDKTLYDVPLEFG